MKNIKIFLIFADCVVKILCFFFFSAQQQYNAVWRFNLISCCAKKNKYCQDIWKIWSVQFDRGHAPLDVGKDSFLLHNNTTMQFEGSILISCCAKKNKYYRDIWKIWSVQFDRGHAPLDVRNDSFLLHNNATMQFEGSILTCCCVKQNKYCLDIWKIWSVQFNRGHAPLDVRNDSFLLHNNTTMQFEGSISRCCCVKQNKYCQDIWKIW